MSLLSKAGLLGRIRRGKKDRAKLVDSNVGKGIAFQIRATRELRRWNQGDLANAVGGMGQNNISRLEDPDYGKHTISSLKRIAEALDVALVVRFVPFSQYIDWLSGTPYLDEGLRPEALAVSSFEDEEKNQKYENQIRYFGFRVTPSINHFGGLVTAYTPQTPMSSAEVHGLYKSPVPLPVLERKVG
jgi:transcriptional regulator with XRE-family HTH domain